MKITVIGTGYVGLVTGTCLSEVGNDVICYDTDANKIEGLTNGQIGIYEPGLDALGLNRLTTLKVSLNSFTMGS